jgi:signal transduction histidine kinase/PAS domain-containing protein
MSTDRPTRSPTAVETSDALHDREAPEQIEQRTQQVVLLRASLAYLRRLVNRKRLLEIRKRLARVDFDLPRRLAVVAWLAVRRWLIANSFSPAWVHPPWDLPRVAFAAAALFQLVAALVTLLIAHFWPALVYPDPLVILTIVLVAVNWGAAPGLVASAVGAFLLNELVVPHFPASLLHSGGTSSAVVILLVGVAISVAASRTERARRHAENLAVDTERARLEADAVRARLDVIIDAMADGVTVHDSLGNLLRANRAARDLFELGDRPADAASQPVDERLEALGLRDDQGHPFAPEHAPLFRILRGEVLTGTDAVDTIRRTRDGCEVLLSLSGAPIRNAAGRIIGAVAITRDVTERRRLERRTQDALDALLAMAETLVLAPGDAEPATDAADGTPSASGVAQRLVTLTRNLLGCQRVEILSLEPESDMVRPLAVAGEPPAQERRRWTEQPAGIRLDDIAERPIIARLRAGHMALLDLRESPSASQHTLYGAGTVLVAPLRLGQTLVGFLSLDHGDAAHVYTPDEMALAGAVAELTALVIERERLLHDQAEARAREIALREATRRMNEFLAIASHELKTPLTVIKTNVQVVARRLNGHATVNASYGDLERVIEQAPVLLQRVERQTDRLTRLVEDLLDVTRIQAGKLEMRPVNCDLAAIVADCVEEQRQAHPTRMITTALPEEPATPVRVVADPERIGQVVTNYLTNALKYSKEDRPISVRVEAAEQQARVSVRDEGPGVPLDEHELVWERFHRVATIDVQSGSGVGLGLGLHISRTIVERHEGMVGLESALGQGSTFWFTLPLAPNPCADIAEEIPLGLDGQRS